MTKFEKIVVGLLIAIMTLSGVTAYEVIKIAHDGFEVDLTVEQAEEIAKEVNDALDALDATEQDFSELTD